MHSYIFLFLFSLASFFSPCAPMLSCFFFSIFFYLLCFTLFRKGSQAPVFVWWWDLFYVSPHFSILLLFFFFFIGWDASNFIFLFLIGLFSVRSDIAAILLWFYTYTLTHMHVYVHITPHTPLRSTKMNVAVASYSLVTTEQRCVMLSTGQEKAEAD